MSSQTHHLDRPTRGCSKNTFQRFIFKIKKPQTNKPQEPTEEASQKRIPDEDKENYRLARTFLC